MSGKCLLQYLRQWVEKSLPKLLLLSGLNCSIGTRINSALILHSIQYNSVCDIEYPSPQLTPASKQHWNI